MTPLARAAATALATPADSTEVCLRVGPIHSKSTVQHIVEYLDELGSYVQTRSEHAEGVRQHFVLAMPSDDPRQQMSELNAAGYPDVQLLRAAPYSGRISIGLYSRLEIAQDTRAKLARAGIETQLQPRITSPQVWYLDAALPPESSTLSIVEQLRAVHRDHPITPTDCPPALAQHLQDTP